MGQRDWCCDYDVGVASSRGKSKYFMLDATDADRLEMYNKNGGVQSLIKLQ